MNKKMSLITLGLFVSFTGSAVELNDISNSDERNIIKTELVKGLVGEHADPSLSSQIKDLNKLNDSENYIFRYNDGQKGYSMIYFRDINSILIEENGRMFDLSSKNAIFDDYNARAIKPVLNAIKKDDIIVFGSEKEDATELYVFTDPTCGYCQMLHSQIEQYEKENFKINYLPFPRGGLKGGGYQMMVNTYCSSDIKSSFTGYKENPSHFNAIPKDGLTEADKKECADIVKKYYDLGTAIGIAGTPSIYTSEGFKVGGYVPAVQLKRSLNSK